MAKAQVAGPEPIQDGAEAEIAVRGLTKRFGSQTVLEDITCDIPKGKITLMLGPSGTGKSVFLKNLMGLLKPEAGEIWIDGKNIPHLGARDLYKVRRKFGVLFQDGALFGSMTIYDNVAFPLREHTRKSEKEIRGIVDEKLKMVGLTGAEGKLPGEISGGMKKRAGLARALVLDPEIVLFDEPDSGLDPVRTAFLNELILDLSKQLGATFIVVTHDIATARRVADYIGMLYLKHLVAFDAREPMFESDMPVVRQFLSGNTDGPIGMSEEADRGRDARSSSGMSVDDVEAMEREAGAPEEPEAAGSKQRQARAELDGESAAQQDGQSGTRDDGRARDHRDDRHHDDRWWDPNEQPGSTEPVPRREGARGDGRVGPSGGSAAPKEKVIRIAGAREVTHRKTEPDQEGLLHRLLRKAQ
jgi:phospholipid/cholesterol/gamma-HCH transport system ATP-binding protein